jgi:2-keto-3-deoxy-L-rhamnonate aldolase RhmA
VGLPDTAQWAHEANQELLVIAMIEEVKALENLDAMFAVPASTLFISVIWICGSRWECRPT